MATYVYETIPQHPGDPVKTFEVRQSMNDAPLERHPETGEPVRRVILGGYGIMGGGKGDSTPAPAPRGGHGCGAGCGCGHGHN